MIICIIIVIVILMVIIYWYTSSDIIVLDSYRSRNLYNKRLKYFEKQMSHWYPLGSDKFRIDHGINYSAFFERIGSPHMVVAGSNHIYGTGCGILRRISQYGIGRCWYICDLKIRADHRGNWLPFKMLSQCFHLKSLASKGYGISMNTPDTPNKIARLCKRIKLIEFKNAGNLLIYSLDYDAIRRIIDVINRHKGATFFVSLTGIKDIILQSTSKPLKLLHMNFVKNIGDTMLDTVAEIFHEPQPGYTHMFCLHEHDVLVKYLHDIGVNTDTSATVIQHGLDKLKPDHYDFIQTSEI